MTDFEQLNEGWNAEPNAPRPSVTVNSDEVVLEFTANSLVYPAFAHGERLRLRFRGVARYRLGPTNDEGWYRGQCRFSDLAPSWGEFFKVTGDVKLDRAPDDWCFVSRALPNPCQLYLFYMRDETFECLAASWTIERPHLGAG
jgi:hypothetical protein